MNVNSMPAKQHGWTARIASLAWPILIGQLATITNGVIDTIMTARYSAMDLAALGLGSSVYISIFVGLSGVLQALSPAIGQLFGARKFTEIGFEVRQGAWLAIFLSLVGAVLLCMPEPLLAIAQPNAALNDKVVQYLQILALALPATLGFRVFTSLNTATSRPRMVMTIQVCALLLKIPLNYLFIFGGGGLPAFGTPGCAIATAVTAWATFATGWFIIRRGSHYQAFQIFGNGWGKPVWRAQAALLKLGLPMGLSYLIEVTAFTFMALFISRLGSNTLAAHQVTGNLGTVLYMLPLSIAHATGTLVAQEIGAGRLVQARHSGNAGIRLGAVLAVSTGIIVWLLREQIIALYTPDASVAAVAIPLFFFISFYQLFDAIQVGAAFVLRAYKVALIPTIMYAFALWGVGLFGGYLLGFNVFGFTPELLQGAAGFWMGNSFSLALVGIALLWYLKHIQRVLEKELIVKTEPH